MGVNTVQNMVIGTILGMVILIGGIFWIGSFYTSDNSLDTSNKISYFNKTMDQSALVAKNAQQIQSDINATSNAGALGWLNALISTAFNGLKGTFNSLSVTSSMVSGIGNTLGFSAINPLMALIALIIIIIIGFAIYAAIMRVNV